MTSGEKQLSRSAIRSLSAIHQYRYQRRSGRVWLVGDKRISTSTVASLEREAFVREIASNGAPRLVLTDEGALLLMAAVCRDDHLNDRNGDRPISAAVIAAVREGRYALPV